MEGGREGCGVDRRGSEQRLPPRSHFQSSFSAVATARRPAAAVGEAERRARCCRVAATEVCKSPPMSVGGGNGHHHFHLVQERVARALTGQHRQVQKSTRLEAHPKQAQFGARDAGSEAQRHHRRRQIRAATLVPRQSGLQAGAFPTGHCAAPSPVAFDSTTFGGLTGASVGFRRPEQLSEVVHVLVHQYIIHRHTLPLSPNCLSSFIYTT